MCVCTKSVVVGDFNHERTIALVGARYKSNCQSFIKFWVNERRVMLASFNLGQEAIVNKMGLALSSEELALYSSKVHGFISMPHCLADDAKNGNGSSRAKENPGL